jgi:hypothetical protein
MRLALLVLLLAGAAKDDRGIYRLKFVSITEGGRASVLLDLYVGQ